MRNSLRLLLGFGLAGIVLAASASLASERTAAETGRTCTSCHDKPGSKLLTDVGKYYETLRTVDGYERLKDSFGRCTACHVRRPGSARLTAKGRQFAQLVSDMPGLYLWMRESHPVPPAK